MHELETEGLLDVEDAGTAVGTRINFIWLGACEPWRGDDLVLVEEDVEAEVVAVEGPTPGSCGGRVSEEDEVVGELIHDARRFDEFTEEVVYAHRFEGLVIALRREGGLKNGENGGAY